MIRVKNILPGLVKVKSVKKEWVFYTFIDSYKGLKETFAREYARVKMVKISPIFVEKLANS